jgi:MtrB/PioB family decaheme-associated outer membrane protein
MVVLAASLLVASQSLAQSDGAATFGGQWWSQTNPESKFREYRDLPRGGYLSDYVLREFNGPWAGAIWGNDALSKSQGNAFYLSNGVTWRLDGSYSETPHNFSFITKSPFVQTSPGVFVLPDVLQQQNQAASGTNYNRGMANVYASTGFTPIGIQTNLSKARLRLRPIKDWQFEVKGSDRERQGNMAYGAVFGMSNAIEMPVPVDQRILDVDATATYVHGPARVLASIGVSDFQNRIPTLIWDNPKALRDSSYWSAPTSTRGSSLTGLGATGRMALWPDNRVVRGTGVFSLNLPYSSVFTATLGISRTTQEQAFIPITMNTRQWGGAVGDSAAGLRANSLAALPALNLGGKVMSITQDYRLTGRLVPALNTTLRVREEKLDDQTPSLAFIHGVSATDQSVSRLASASAANETEEWSNTKDVFGLDADYAVNSKANVGLLAEHRIRKHPLREVEKDAENVFGANVRLRPMDNVSVTGSYKYGQRKQDSFDAGAYDGTERSDMRRLDLANRNQSIFNATAMWAPSEMLDLSVSGWWSKDDYPDTRIGLQSSENAQVFGEAGIHPTAVLDLTGGFGYGRIKGKQAGVEGGSTADPAVLSDPWSSNVDDKNVYAYANASWWAKPKKVRFDVQYTFTRDLQINTLADTLTAMTPGLDISLPGAFYRTHELALEGRWFYTAGLELGARYEYTKYDVSDYMNQAIPYLDVNPTSPSTAATAIYMGNNRMSFKANRIQVFATRRF